MLNCVLSRSSQIFSCNYTSVDAEIERLKPLIELGGFIPCPDHRIAPDTKWDNVRYYCDKMKEGICKILINRWFK